MCAQQFAPVRQNTIAAPQIKNPVSKVSVIDGHNLWLPAAQISAARIGLAASTEDAARDRIIDHSLRINIPRLGDFVFGENARTNCFGAVVSSTLAGNTSAGAVYESYVRAGWSKKIILTRQEGRGEKQVDTTIALELVEATILRGLKPEETEVTLVGVDRDHIPAIEMLARYGFAVDVIGWRHATSWEMIQAATGRFIALDDYFEQLTFRKTVH